MGKPISKKFIADLKEGYLTPILDLVKADDTLEMELREDHVTIYYRGYYFLYINEISPNNYSFVSPWKIYATLEEVINDFANIKNDIDLKKPISNPDNEAKNTVELEYSQLVMRYNNRTHALKDVTSSDYVITDMEDTIHINDKKMEPDLIGFKFKGPNRSKAVLTLIKTKYNDGAIGGTNGIQKHVEDFIELFYQNDDFIEIYKQKHKCILFDKVLLGLIEKPGFKGLDYDKLKERIDKINITDLECLLVISNYRQKLDIKPFDTLEQEIFEIVTYTLKKDIPDFEFNAELKSSIQLIEQYDFKNTDILLKVYIANANFMGTELYFWENDRFFTKRRFQNVLEYFVKNIYYKLDIKVQKKYKVIKDKYTFDK